MIEGICKCTVAYQLWDSKVGWCRPQFC